METFSVQFLGSVEVPYHQGNGILCAAMQKVRESVRLCGFQQGVRSGLNLLRKVHFPVDMMIKLFSIVSSFHVV